MNMGALFYYSAPNISPDDDITSGDIGFCWPCHLRNAYNEAIWKPEGAGPDWFLEVAESL